MIEIVQMTETDIEQVYTIEQETFSIPWSKEEFKKEMRNKIAYYFVAKYHERIVGYGGMWHVVNEGHITNVAVADAFRGSGIGKLLVNALIEKAKLLEMMGLTLEVKISNTNAQRLYTALGFKPEGIRKNYYEDTKEDAIIMWKYL